MSCAAGNLLAPCGGNFVAFLLRQSLRSLHRLQSVQSQSPTLHFAISSPVDNPMMKFALLAVIAALAAATPSRRQQLGMVFSFHEDCLVAADRRLLETMGVPVAHLNCEKRHELVEIAKAQEVESVRQEIVEALGPVETF
ncbi:hypothetical protein LEN26_000814 [Aphanomyces euteiches]|nr:hypothetical protein LEN26_000814 [Aphanomyces euteiches]